MSQAGDPGAIPGGSTLATQSRGPTATTLGSHPGNDGSIPSGTTLSETTCPDTPSRRAARLRPGCLQVRLLFWVLAEHYVLVEQLGVLATLSRWRPSVQIRSGTLTRHGTPTGRATDFKRPWLWVRLPPVLLEQHASAGHWRAHVAVTHTPLAVQVQLLPGALKTWPVRLAAGCETLTLAAWVRFPYGSLTD